MNTSEIARLESTLSRRTWHADTRTRYSWMLFRHGDDWAKRAFDIVVSSTLLLLLAPCLLLIAAMVKLGDGGPVLFWQVRVGRAGRHFAFPKFRSMRTDAEAVLAQLKTANDHGQGCVTFKLEQDPRITRVGRLLRKFSLDELPQLWCVVCGDMSLVGPRPALPSEVARYTLAQRRRLAALPGLTCIWQISGRSQIPFPQQVELDVRYIETRSFWLDLQLLLKTIPAVLFARGAC